jgi:hypothetical protein
MNVVNIVKNKFNNEFNNLLKYWDMSEQVNIIMYLIKIFRSIHSKSLDL